MEGSGRSGNRWSPLFFIFILFFVLCSLSLRVHTLPSPFQSRLTPYFFRLFRVHVCTATREGPTPRRPSTSVQGDRLYVFRVTSPTSTSRPLVPLSPSVPSPHFSFPLKSWWSPVPDLSGGPEDLPLDLLSTCDSRGHHLLCPLPCPPGQELGN